MSKIAFLTSPPFACGLAWLVNAMLRLGVKTTSLGYGEKNWVQNVDGSFSVSSEAQKHMESHLPVLLSSPCLNFEKSYEFYWEHRLNFIHDPVAPVVVVIRDPRDAIYSLHRRWKAMGWYNKNFESFLTEPSHWPDHFPGLFHLNPVKTIILFQVIWLIASKIRPVKFIRFEDLKLKPEESLSEVLKFLNISKTSEEISEACQSSDVKNSSAAFDKVNGMQAIFRGQTYEWKQSYSQLDLNIFDRNRVGGLLEFFGYEGSGAGTERFWMQFLKKYQFDGASFTEKHFINMTEGGPIKPLYGLRVGMISSLWAKTIAPSSKDKALRKALQRELNALLPFFLEESELDHIFKNSKIDIASKLFYRYSSIFTRMARAFIRKFFWFLPKTA